MNDTAAPKACSRCSTPFSMKAEDWLAALADSRSRLSSRPAHGVAALGLMTEVGALSATERQTIVDWAAEDIAGRTPLLVTIVGSTIAEAVRLARHAQSAGAAYLAIQPLLGAKPSLAELSEFYAAIMRSVSVPVGIQNAPEYLGVGLDPEAVKILRAQHPNFLLMKGEGAVFSVKPFIDSIGADLAVFCGRGGLELPDNLRAGCAGVVPAPDCADIQVSIYEAWRAGDEDRMDALYKRILPYIVFAMQALPVAIFYGKRMFARRARIENSCACRMKIAPEGFFDAAMIRWSSRLGAYGNGGRDAA